MAAQSSRFGREPRRRHHRAASGIGFAARPDSPRLGMKVLHGRRQRRRARRRRREASRGGDQPPRRRPSCAVDVSDLDDGPPAGRGLRGLRRRRHPHEQRRDRRAAAAVRRPRELEAHSRRQSLGRHPWRAGVRARHGQAGTTAAIVNTGSKQGITCPPGDTAYNVSKAGVKVVTEALAHELRNMPGCKVTAHLLIPGFTFTGITAGRPPEAARRWTARTGRRLHGRRHGQAATFTSSAPTTTCRARWTSGACLGGAGHHREPPAAVALASGLQGGLRPIRRRPEVAPRQTAGQQRRQGDDSIRHGTCSSDQAGSDLCWKAGVYLRGWGLGRDGGGRNNICMNILPIPVGGRACPRSPGHRDDRAYVDR